MHSNSKAESGAAVKCPFPVDDGVVAQGLAYSCPAPAYDYAVAIGRFQPVHWGHVALLHMCLQHARRVVVVAGSAHQPRSCKNPFTVQERAAMLHAVLSAHDRARVQVCGVDDMLNDAAWVAAIEAQVRTVMVDDGVLEPTAMRVALVGHLKDASSYYLRLFVRWQWLPVENVAGINATDIRVSYFAATQRPDALWRQAAILPASTVDFLQSFRNTKHGKALCAACATA